MRAAFGSQSPQVERPKLIPRVAQRRPPLVSADTAKVGWSKGADQVANEEQVIIGHPSLLFVALPAEHTLGGTVDLADGNLPVKGMQCWSITRVYARHADQRHDLGFLQVLGVDLVLVAQTAGNQVVELEMVLERFGIVNSTIPNQIVEDEASLLSEQGF